MKLKEISKKRLLKKAFEDGIKKSVEMVIVGFVIGLSLNMLLLAVGAVMGGCLYHKDNQIKTGIGGK